MLFMFQLVWWFFI